jgi:hypothetical protein
VSKPNPPPLPRDAAAAREAKKPSSERDEVKHLGRLDNADYAIGGGIGRFSEPEPPLAAIQANPLWLVDDPVEFERTLSPQVQRRLKGIVERIQVGDTAEGEAAVRELLEIVDNRLDDVVRGRTNSYPAQGMRQRFAEHDTRQGIYLTASGTLTQFNAILAAVQATALATVELGVLKASMVAALVSHVVAAFFLCWAARPVDGAPHQTAAMALVETHTLTDDTFRNYKRGWRMTLIALAVSAVAAGLFVLHSVGISIPVRFMIGQ